MLSPCNVHTFASPLDTQYPTCLLLNNDHALILADETNISVSKILNIFLFSCADSDSANGHTFKPDFSVNCIDSIYHVGIQTTFAM